MPHEVVDIVEAFGQLVALGPFAFVADNDRAAPGQALQPVGWVEWNAGRTTESLCPAGACMAGAGGWRRGTEATGRVRRVTFRRAVRMAMRGKVGVSAQAGIHRA